jgi:hypothetical protein
LANVTPSLSPIHPLRLLAVWFEQEETIVAVFGTGFGMEFPYERKELIIFSIIGVFCGFGGSLYVYLHRR